MTTQKQTRLELFKIINDSIETEAYTAQEFSTVAKKSKYVLQCFHKEYYDPREPNYTKRVADWLQGLPSVITVPFYNNEIVEIGYKLDLSKKGKRQSTTETNEQKFIGNWFELLAHEFIQMSQMKPSPEKQLNDYLQQG